ncbi:MAG: hypothetical protein [Wendovervirus sonii]|uniref:Uncharacterized protein n=1 Tax=phage Lak_Megaphage_Sonny TaxID=3109229 RepID=A0ABZ0Z5K1_9CAUD|nr:MAG: hypothetical protein [phage Lak_Megaphage_Sonny]
MSINKFEKYRAVDNHYLNVPYKYILDYNGSNMNPKYKVFSRDEAFEQWGKENPDDYNKWISGCPNDVDAQIEYEKIGKKINAYFDALEQANNLKNRNKTLCIVDFFGKNKALVAWRNNKTYKMGMTRLCKIIHKKQGRYLLYKGHEIFIDQSNGWVF